jgi:hypothetical protein
MNFYKINIYFKEFIKIMTIKKFLIENLFKKNELNEFK